MKKSRTLFALVLVVVSLCAAWIVTSSAATELPGGTTLENVMQFAGVEAEYTGLNGIRGVFTVNDAEIKKLEDAGCTVAYGAVVGYRANYATPGSLTIDSKENADKITVYKAGNKTDAYFLESESGVSKFAIATFFGSKAETVDARRGMIYRGYIEIRRPGYTNEIHYVDATWPNPDEVVSLYNTLSYAAENGYYKESDIFMLLDRFEAATNVVYVDPKVSQSGDGKTAATAVKTVKEGYEKAVALINAAEEPIDVVIDLAPGKHSITEKLDIKGTDITTAVEYSITFSGSKSSEKSIVSSNFDIPASAFVKKKDLYEYQLPDSAKIDGQYPAFRDLSFDGQMGKLATSQGLFKMKLDSCTRASDNGLNADDRLLYVSPDALGAVEVDASGNVIGDLEFWVQTEWQVHCVHIEHIDYNKETNIVQDGVQQIAVRVRKGDWDAFKGKYYQTLANRRYWFVNNKAYLDEKGEFWYDRENGKIYCIPFESLSETNVISYPVAERIFHLEKAKNITFRNLDITGTTVNYITEYGYITGQGGYIKRPWTNPDTGKTESGKITLPYGAIYGKDVENIRISACSFYAIGGDCVNFRGAVDRVRVNHSSMVSIGGCVIRLGVSDDSVKYTNTTHNKDIVIDENYMQDIAKNFNSSTAILVTSVRDMDITNNTILDTAYSAISVGWSWSPRRADTSTDRDSWVNVKNVNIAYNYIENFMTVTQDGGAIYVLGGNASEKTTTYLNSMNNNYVVLSGNVSNGSRQWTVFYHDGGASHWHDYDNVLVIDPKSPLPNHHYISYQSIASQQAYNNLSERYYIIGYRPDYLAYRGEYDEDGNYVKKSDWTETHYKNYLPSWYDTKYPGWAESWITKGERPDIHVGWFVGFAATSLTKADMETFVSTENPDGGISISYSKTDDDNNFFRDIYLYTDFASAEGTVGGTKAAELAEVAGCDGYHPTYGKWSAKK